MDNKRFNITGASLEELIDVLELIFKWEFDYPKIHSKENDGYGYFTGYSIDPNLGFILYQYPLSDQVNDKKILCFPFEEGKKPETLATFIYNYLNSDKAKVIDPPRDEKEDAYDEYDSMRHDFEWDKSCDHDGDNDPAWRVFTGKWGNVPGCSGNACYAIRPIVGWYGK